MTLLISVCSTCLEKVEGKIIFQDGQVFMLKRCPRHGSEKVLIADDVDYYRRCREVFIKPPEMPNVYNTPVKWGCPYDCGLCSDHEQHSCLSLIEINDHCNLNCPVCYAESGTATTASLPQPGTDSEAMVAGGSAGTKAIRMWCRFPEANQRCILISFRVLDLCKAAAHPPSHGQYQWHPNCHTIKTSPADLAGYMPDFELYLQFDSFERHAAHGTARRRPARDPPQGRLTASTNWASPPRWW